MLSYVITHNFSFLIVFYGIVCVCDIREKLGNNLHFLKKGILGASKVNFNLRYRENATLINDEFIFRFPMNHSHLLLSLFVQNKSLTK